MTIEHELTDPVDEYSNKSPEELAYNEALMAHLQVQNRRLAECESALFVNRLIVVVALALMVAHLFLARGA